MSTTIASEWSDAVSFTVRAMGNGYQQTSKFIAPDVVSGDRFGASVSIDEFGESMLVGAPLQDNGSSVDNGAVYVYKNVNSLWKLQTKISSAVAGQQFGSAVHLSADGLTAYIGASNDSTGGSLNGVVYIFTRTDIDSTGWSYQTAIYPDTQVANEIFGKSISVSRDQTVMVVGSYSQRQAAYSGSVYVYKKGTNGWYPFQRIYPTEFEAYQLFGSGVSLSHDGQTLAIGAGSQDSEAADAGYVYTYVQVNGFFVEAGMIYPPNFNPVNSVPTTGFGMGVALNNNGTVLAIGTKNAGFCIYERQNTQAFIFKHSVPGFAIDNISQMGYYMSMSSASDILVVGAPIDSSKTVNSGAVYVFERTVSNLVYQSQLYANVPTVDQSYGKSVSVTNTADWVFVGAHTETAGGLATAGAVYIYSRNGSFYERRQKLISNVPVTNGLFGIGVAVSGDGTVALISEPNTSHDSQAGMGLVHYYRKVNEVWTYINTFHENVYSPVTPFGDTLSINSDGTAALISQYSWTDASSCVYYFTRSGDTWTQVQKFNSPQPQANERFGTGICISKDGQSALISSFQRTSGGVSQCGEVYYYKLITGSWTYQSTITTPIPLTGGFFGLAVAMNGAGTRALIAQMTDSTSDNMLGVMFDFTLSGGVWTLYDKHYQGTKLQYVGFPCSIACNNSMSIVFAGAFADPSSGVAGGAVNIFTDPNTIEADFLNETMLEGLKHFPSDPAAGQYFGVSVALDASGTYAAVGACYDNDRGTQAGAVYIFKNTGGLWTEQTKIYGADRSKAGDLFGVSVSFNADASVLAIGSTQGNTNTLISSGAVYIFEREGDSWLEKRAFSSPTATSNWGKNFGRSVSLNAAGNLIAVGCPAENYVYVFSLNTSNNYLPSLVQKFTYNDSVVGDYFGQCVEMSGMGEYIFVGAPLHDNTLTDTGKVYIFKSDIAASLPTNYSYLTTIVCPEEANTSSAFGNGIGVSYDASSIFISKNGDTTGGTSAGAIYQFSRVNTTFTLVKKILAGDAKANRMFGYDIACNYDATINLVGAVGDSENNTNAGAFYSFSKNNALEDGLYYRSSIHPTDAAAGSHFGAGCALSANGDYALVGASDDNAAGANYGSVYIFKRNNFTWTQAGKILPPENTANAWFGIVLALSESGLYLAVGAPNKSSALGAVYIYKRSSTSLDDWAMVQKLTSPDAAVNVMFGSGVSFSSDASRLFVGADADQATGLIAGRVYTYALSGATYTYQQTINSPSTDTYTRFGSSVSTAADGVYLVVGACYDSTYGFHSGAVHIYRFSASLSQWVYQNTLYSNDISNNATFGVGATVSYDGVRLYVSSSIDNQFATQGGSVQYFERNVQTDTWVYKNTIYAPKITAVGNFGRQVALSKYGNHVLIAERMEDTAGVDAGALHYYSNGGRFALTAPVDTDFKLRGFASLADIDTNDLLGYSVTIHPSMRFMYVGARNKDIGGIDNSGIFYGFKRINNAWVPIWKDYLLPSDYAVMGTTPAFGASLSFEPYGNYLAVGSPGDARYGNGCGAVYIYNTPNSGDGLGFTSHSVIAPPTALNGQAFGESASLSQDANYIAIGAPFYTGTVTNQGCVYVFTRSGTTWTLQQQIVSPTPVANSRFGNPCRINATGDMLFVSAYNESTTQNLSGASGCVYVFKRTGSSWSYFTKILPPVKMDGMSVGLSYDATTSVLYISGRPVVGGETVVYVYDVSSGTPVYTGTNFSVYSGENSSDYTSTARFEVAPRAGWAAVSQAYSDRNGVNSGAVAMYSRTNWNPRVEIQKRVNVEQRVLPSVQGLGVHFGTAVGVSSDESWMGVGEWNASVGAVNTTGRVQLFKKNADGIWTFNQFINDPNPLAGNLFGSAVSFDYTATTMVVGNYTNNTNSNGGSGIVYIYTRSGNTWTLATSLYPADSAAGDGFGRGVSLRSDALTLYIGANGKMVGGKASAGCVYIFTRPNASSTTWTQQTVITADDGIASDNFGTGVKISGDGYTLVVSAINEGYSTSNNGGIYAYRCLSDTAWALQSKFYAPDPAQLQYFGTDVALSYNGDTLAVGAPSAGRPYSESGAVYIYTRLGCDYIYRKKMYAPAAVATEKFGFALCFPVSGNRLYVGAPRDTVKQALDGSVYVMNVNYSSGSVKPGSRLIPVRAFVNPSPVAGANSSGGSAISADKTKMILGMKASGPNLAGQVFYYEKINNVWTQTGVITPPDGLANDYFGSAVAANSDLSLIVVGAWGKPYNGTPGGGAVYFYSRSGTTFTLQYETVSPGAVGYSDFGIGVAMTADGTLAAVSCFNPDTTDPQDGNGNVRLYTRSGSTWTHQQKISSPDAVTGDAFGSNVALSGDGLTMIVGARFRDDQPPLVDSGAFYMFTRPNTSSTTWTLQTKIYDPFAENSSRWGAGAALTNDGQTAFLANYRNTWYGGMTGRVHRFTRSGNVWTWQEEMECPIRAENGNSSGVGLSCSPDGTMIVISANSGAGNNTGTQIFFANPKLNPEFFYNLSLSS